MTPKLGPWQLKLSYVEDLKFGQVKVMRWSGFHFLQSPNRAMEIIRVEVIKPVGRNRKFQPFDLLGWVRQCLH